VRPADEMVVVVFLEHGVSLQEPGRISNPYSAR
jgi:hypothetical protein